jgi:hypothetical protein
VFDLDLGKTLQTKSFTVIKFPWAISLAKIELRTKNQSLGKWLSFHHQGELVLSQHSHG